MESKHMVNLVAQSYTQLTSEFFEKASKMIPGEHDLMEKVLSQHVQ